MEVKSFQIEISETLNRVIDLKADSLESALEIARNRYKKEKIILSSADFLEVTFSEWKNDEL